MNDLQCTAKGKSSWKLKLVLAVTLLLHPSNKVNLNLLPSRQEIRVVDTAGEFLCLVHLKTHVPDCGG